MFAVVLSGLAVYQYAREVRGLRMAAWAALTGCILVPVIALWGAARLTGLENMPEIASNLMSRDSQYMYAQVMDEFSTMDSFAAILHGGTRVFPYRYGATYLDAVSFVIPRFMWPEKPKAFSVAVGDYALGPLNDGNDIPPGVVGEFYINFGVLGVIAGSLLMGFVMRRFYQRCMQGSIGRIALYGMAIPYYGTFLTRNVLGVGVMITIATIQILVALRYIEGSSSRSNQRAAREIPLAAAPTLSTGAS
jgi:oligosaccharide repeat unit polymerase